VDSLLTTCILLRAIFAELFQNIEAKLTAGFSQSYTEGTSATVSVQVPTNNHGTLTKGTAHHLLPRPATLIQPHPHPLGVDGWGTFLPFSARLHLRACLFALLLWLS